MTPGGGAKRPSATTVFSGGLALSLRVPAGRRADVAGFAMVGSYDASHAEFSEEERASPIQGTVKNVREQRLEFQRTVGWLSGVRLSYHLPAGWRVGATAGYRFLPLNQGTLATTQPSTSTGGQGWPEVRPYTGIRPRPSISAA